MVIPLVVICEKERVVDDESTSLNAGTGGNDPPSPELQSGA